MTGILPYVALHFSEQVAEVFEGEAAEGQSLEDIATTLNAEDA